MTAWWLVPVVGIGALVALEAWRRQYARDHAADYVERISVLKSETPLVLPAVKKLEGRIVPKKRRRAPVVSPRVSRFRQRVSK